MLMLMHQNGIESYTCVPWGQSAHPDSPHHLDQAEHLFSKRILKPTWWRKEDLLPNVKTEKALTLVQ
jgi:acyl-homoserine lactone acylase PvdQ